MSLREIVNVGGKPGLFKLIGKSRTGVLIESISDQKRITVPATSAISNLSEIAIYTTAEERPLGQVLTAMLEIEPEIRTLDIKRDKDGVRILFEKVVPDYAEHKVHTSDMQKCFRWFLLLRDAGLSQFLPNDKEDEESEQDSPELTENQE